MWDEVDTVVRRGETLVRIVLKGGDPPRDILLTTDAEEQLVSDLTRAAAKAKQANDLRQREGEIGAA